MGYIYFIYMREIYYVEVFLVISLEFGFICWSFKKQYKDIILLDCLLEVYCYK